jgi:hypothetical protein
MKKKILLSAWLVLVAIGASAQRLEATSEVIDCGQVLYNHPVTVAFEIKNKGNRASQISNVRTSCGCAMVDYPKQAIDGGDTFSVKATYDARQMGHFVKQIGIYTEAGKKPLMLTIKGNVVDEIVDFSGDYPLHKGDLLADKDDIEFDDVSVGEQPVAKIHIFNPTSQTAKPVIMHLPNYLKASVSPSEIAPNHSGVASVMLDSRLLRDYGLTQTSVFLGFMPGDKVSSGKEISVSAVLLPRFNEMTEQQRAVAPKIQLSATTVQLAFGEKKKEKKVIAIQNTGKSTLIITNLQMFTTGLQVSLGKSQLAPGESTELKITGEQKGLKNARSKPRVLMITNDPDQPKVVIHINVE